jgi:hypothetical protein
LPLQHVEQMHGVGGDFDMVEVEHLRQNLEGEAGGNAGHSLIDPGIIAILLHRLGLGIGVFQVLAIVDPHLGETGWSFPVP